MIMLNKLHPKKTLKSCSENVLVASPDNKNDFPILHFHALCLKTVFT